MVDFAYADQYDFPRLLEIMRLLRAPGGCPWDAEQTHDSIRRNRLEEAYEVCEAIDLRDDVLLCEELGDVLLQVVFHARMAEEAGVFSIDDVIDGICQKLIIRHPHVFGDAQAHTAGEVLSRWEEIKQETKGQESQSAAMQSVARSLPALTRAEKVQKKAAKVGFDWPEVSGALDKLSEEQTELREALAGRGDPEEELGDLLFSAVNAARLSGIDPERALEKATEKFITRFTKVEQAAGELGKSLREMDLAEMDRLWEQVK